MTDRMHSTQPLSYDGGAHMTNANYSGAFPPLCPPIRSNRSPPSKSHMASMTPASRLLRHVRVPKRNTLRTLPHAPSRVERKPHPATRLGNTASTLHPHLSPPPHVHGAQQWFGYTPTPAGPPAYTISCPKTKSCSADAHRAMSDYNKAKRLLISQHQARTHAHLAAQSICRHVDEYPTDVSSTDDISRAHSHHLHSGGTNATPKTREGGRDQTTQQQGLQVFAELDSWVKQQQHGHHAPQPPPQLSSRQLHQPTPPAVKEQGSDTSAFDRRGDGGVRVSRGALRDGRDCVASQGSAVNSADPDHNMHVLDGYTHISANCNNDNGEDDPFPLPSSSSIDDREEEWETQSRAHSRRRCESARRHEQLDQVLRGSSRLGRDDLSGANDSRSTATTPRYSNRRPVEIRTNDLGHSLFPSFVPHPAKTEDTLKMRYNIQNVAQQHAPSPRGGPTNEELYLRSFSTLKKNSAHYARGFYKYR